MADAVVSTVLANAAALLGDNSAEQFTSAVLLPYFGLAYRECYDIFQRWKLPLGRRTAFYVLPAYTEVFSPSQAGLTDFSEPLEAWDRGGVTTLTITGITNATPMEVTTPTDHNLNTNDEVQIYGVASPVVGVNWEWRITKTASNKFTLNGSIAGGVWSSGGTVVHSEQAFCQMVPQVTLAQYDPEQKLRYWKWENGRMWFVGSSEVRELKLIYTASGAPPSSGSVGIDDSENFLTLATAAKAAEAYDMPTRANQLTRDAYGPSGEPDGTGGALRGLVAPMLLQKQQIGKRAGRFRPRRLRDMWPRNTGY